MSDQKGRRTESQIDQDHDGGAKNKYIIFWPKKATEGDNPVSIANRRFHKKHGEKTSAKCGSVFSGKKDTKNMPVTLSSTQERRCGIRSIPVF